MIPRGGIGANCGKIVNIASLLSFQGGIRVPAYAASKGGVAQLTKALANEWAPKGIQVNAIAPGYFATTNTEALQADETRNRQILERIPARPLGEIRPLRPSRRKRSSGEHHWPGSGRRMPIGVYDISGRQERRRIA